MFKYTEFKGFVLIFLLAFVHESEPIVLHLKAAIATSITDGLQVLDIHLWQHKTIKFIKLGTAGDTQGTGITLVENAGVILPLHL